MVFLSFGCCLSRGKVREPLSSVEFGFAGIDSSVAPDVWQEVFAPLEQGIGIVRFVASFQLAYQGFPWKPTDAYTREGAAESRRYGGLVYPAWYEIDEILRSLPDGLPSFHLNETAACPYVSGLLKGDPDMLKLVSVLVEQYHAHHIQINITAHGVPTDLFTVGSPAAKTAAKVLLQLCEDYPNTTFILPIAEISSPEEEPQSTWPFLEPFVTGDNIQQNLCGFFDNSGGNGKEPDKAPDLPPGYSSSIVGFTGGIQVNNVKFWLDQYARRAKQGGCTLITDAQTGFREGRKRGNPIDVEALRGLSRAVRQWAAEQDSVRPET